MIRWAVNVPLPGASVAERRRASFGKLREQHRGGLHFLCSSRDGNVI